MSAKLSQLQRIWRATVFVLRVICLALLVLMFSLKLRDFLRQPVVSETSVVSVPPPALTICPSALNSTALEEHEEEWDLGILTTEAVLQDAAVSLTCSVLACSTANDETCAPDVQQHGRCSDDGMTFHRGGASNARTNNGSSEGPIRFVESGFSSELRDSSNNSSFRALWQSRRVPPGITCHTLKLSSAPGTTIGEIVLTLALCEMFAHFKDGYYRLFFHAERSPKTWYGGTLVSPYHLVF